MVNELTATDQRVKKKYNMEYNTQSCWQGNNKQSPRWKNEIGQTQITGKNSWMNEKNTSLHHWTAIDNFIPPSAEMDPLHSQRDKESQDNFGFVS